MAEEEFFKQQEKEQKIRRKFKKSVKRQNELKLMKAARRSLGKSLVSKKARELVRKIIRTFLEEFPFNAVNTIISFLPVHAWEEDIDLFGETVYLDVFNYNAGHSARWSNNYHCKSKPMLMTSRWGPNSEPCWESVKGRRKKYELSRYELRIGREALFVCSEGLTPNKMATFTQKIPRDYAYPPHTLNVLVTPVTDEHAFKRMVGEEH